MLVIGLHRALLKAIIGCAPFASSVYLASLGKQLGNILLSLFQILCATQGGNLVAADEVLGLVTLASAAGNGWGDEVTGFRHLDSFYVSGWYWHWGSVSSRRKADTGSAKGLIVLPLTCRPVPLRLLGPIIIWLLPSFNPFLGTIRMCLCLRLRLLWLQLRSLRHEARRIVLFIRLCHAIAPWEELSTITLIARFRASTWCWLCLLNHADWELGFGEHLGIWKIIVGSWLGTVLRVTNHMATALTSRNLRRLRTRINPSSGLRVIHLNLLRHQRITALWSTPGYVRLIIICRVNYRRILPNKSTTIV